MSSIILSAVEQFLISMDNLLSIASNPRFTQTNNSKTTFLHNVHQLIFFSSHGCYIYSEDFQFIGSSVLGIHGTRDS